MNYYRLKQIDIDGSFKFTPINGVKFESIRRIHLFPNPTSSYIIIQGLNGSEVIELFDVPGKLMSKQKNSNHTATISFHALSTGTYFVKIIDPQGHINIYKILKQ